MSATSQSKRPLSTISPHDGHFWVPAASTVCHGAPQLGHGKVRAGVGGLVRAPIARVSIQRSTENFLLPFPLPTE